MRRVHLHCEGRIHQPANAATVVAARTLVCVREDLLSSPFVCNLPPKQKRSDCCVIARSDERVILKQKLLRLESVRDRATSTQLLSEVKVGRQILLRFLTNRLADCCCCCLIASLVVGIHKMPQMKGYLQQNTDTTPLRMSSLVPRAHFHLKGLKNLKKPSRRDVAIIAIHVAGPRAI